MPRFAKLCAYYCESVTPEVEAALSESEMSLKSPMRQEAMESRIAIKTVKFSPPAERDIIV